MTIFAIDLPHEQLKTKNMYTVDYLKTLHAVYVEWNTDPGSMIMPKDKLVTETQKGDRYSLPILSLLYPDYDLTAVEYELQKTPNIQKGDKQLKDWVNEQTQGKDKKTFLDEHLIPDVLEEKDITDFFNKRKELLVEKLQNALK